MKLERIIDYAASIAIALALALIAVGITKIVYTPTDRDIGRVVEGQELIQHKKLMKKHGQRNTEAVLVYQDGSQWYRNEAGQLCRFK